VVNQVRILAESACSRMTVASGAQHSQGLLEELGERKQSRSFRERGGRRVRREQAGGERRRPVGGGMA